MTGGGEVPLIELYDGSTHVGKLSFHPDTPPANLLSSSNVIYLRFKLSQFGDVMGILRMESPLKVSFDTTQLQGYLGTTSYEPVGEQET